MHSRELYPLFRRPLEQDVLVHATAICNTVRRIVTNCIDNTQWPIVVRVRSQLRDHYLLFSRSISSPEIQLHQLVLGDVSIPVTIKVQLIVMFRAIHMQA